MVENSSPSEVTPPPGIWRALLSTDSSRAWSWGRRLSSSTFQSSVVHFHIGPVGRGVLAAGCR